MNQSSSRTALAAAAAIAIISMAVYYLNRNKTDKNGSLLQMHSLDEITERKQKTEKQENSSDIVSPDESTTSHVEKPEEKNAVKAVLLEENSKNFAVDRVVVDNERLLNHQVVINPCHSSSSKMLPENANLSNMKTPLAKPKPSQRVVGKEISKGKPQIIPTYKTDTVMNSKDQGQVLFSEESLEGLEDSNYFSYTGLLIDPNCFSLNSSKAQANMKMLSSNFNQEKTSKSQSPFLEKISEKISTKTAAVSPNKDVLKLSSGSIASKADLEKNQLLPNKKDASEESGPVKLETNSVTEFQVMKEVKENSDMLAIRAKGSKTYDVTYKAEKPLNSDAGAKDSQSAAATSKAENPLTSDTGAKDSKSAAVTSKAEKILNSEAGAKDSKSSAVTSKAVKILNSDAGAKSADFNSKDEKPLNSDTSAKDSKSAAVTSKTEKILNSDTSAKDSKSAAVTSKTEKILNSDTSAKDSKSAAVTSKADKLLISDAGAKVAKSDDITFKAEPPLNSNAGANDSKSTAVPFNAEKILNSNAGVKETKSPPVESTADKLLNSNSCPKVSKSTDTTSKSEKPINSVAGGKDGKSEAERTSGPSVLLTKPEIKKEQKISANLDAKLKEDVKPPVKNCVIPKENNTNINSVNVEIKVAAVHPEPKWRKENKANPVAVKSWANHAVREVNGDAIITDLNNPSEECIKNKLNLRPGIKLTLKQVSPEPSDIPASKSSGEKVKVSNDMLETASATAKAQENLEKKSEDSQLHVSKPAIKGYADAVKTLTRVEELVKKTALKPQAYIALKKSPIQEKSYSSEINFSLSGKMKPNSVTALEIQSVKVNPNSIFMNAQPEKGNVIDGSPFLPIENIQTPAQITIAQESLSDLKSFPSNSSMRVEAPEFVPNGSAEDFLISEVFDVNTYCFADQIQDEYYNPYGAINGGDYYGFDLIATDAPFPILPADSIDADNFYCFSQPDNINVQNFPSKAKSKRKRTKKSNSRSPKTLTLANYLGSFNETVGK